MTCHHCQGNAKRHGRDSKGAQRFRCRMCGKTFLEEQDKPLGDMRISEESAILALKLLAEGTSIRGIERLTGMHRDTVLRLLVMIGERCEGLLTKLFNGVKVADVQLDETWSFVGMKEKAKKKKGIKDDRLGDAYCYTAFDRNSKAILAWHLGKRDTANTVKFIDKLDAATDGRFQVSTDGWMAYPDAIHTALGLRVDHGVIVKTYATEQDTTAARYSPPVVVKIDREAAWGKPEKRRICTSHVERENLTMRIFIKRLNRLTICFSRKWENHKAALALFFAYYNLCRVHRSIRCTPGMEAGVTDHIWTIEELLEKSATF